MTLPSFPYPNPQSWSQLLSSELGRSVDVRFGRARRQVIVVQERGGKLHVRMNAIFGAAPLDVAQAVAKWMKSGRRASKACKRLDDWIAEIESQLEPARTIRLRPRGSHYDLQPIMESLFAGELKDQPFASPDPKITWGRRSSSRPRRSTKIVS